MAEQNIAIIVNKMIVCTMESEIIKLNIKFVLELESMRLYFPLIFLLFMVTIYSLL